MKQAHTLTVHDLTELIFQSFAALQGQRRFEHLRDLVDSDEFVVNLFPEHRAADDVDPSIKDGVQVVEGLASKTWEIPVDGLLTEYVKGIIRARILCNGCKEDKLRWVLQTDSVYVVTCDRCATLTKVRQTALDFSDLDNLAKKLYDNRRVNKVAADKLWTPVPGIEVRPTE